MGIFSFAAKKLYYNKKGIKKTLEIHKKSQQNRYIDKNFDKGSETQKQGMVNKYLKNKSDLKKLVKGELSKFKKGKFVQAKCKLGRNRPTKLY